MALAALPAPPPRQPNDQRGRQDQHGHRGRNQNDRRAQDEQPHRVAAPAPNPELPPARARLHVITREASIGQQKSTTSEEEEEEEDNPTKNWEVQPIIFTKGDLRGRTSSRDGALTAELEISGQKVDGILLDTGSEPNVLFLHAYDRMQLNPALLKPCPASLYGFNNAPTGVEGMITLPVLAGQGPQSMIISVDFMIVENVSPYNAILGRPFLHDLKGIISQAHMCVKFPTPRGVGVIRMRQRFDEWAARTEEDRQIGKRDQAEVPGSRKAARALKRARKSMKKMGKPGRGKGLRWQEEASGRGVHSD